MQAICTYVHIILEKLCPIVASIYKLPIYTDYIDYASNEESVYQTCA